MVAAEKMSRLVDWGDRATCVLFGDGAAAAVLSAGGQNPLAMRLETEPSVEILHVPGIGGSSPYDATEHPASSLSMEGRRVFKFGVNAICTSVTELAREAGNISSACVPLALDRLVRSGQLGPGQLVALVGFGAGLDTGACLLRWE